MSFALMDSITATVIGVWLEGYRRNKAATIGLTIVLSVALIVLIVVQENRQSNELQARQDISFQEQLAQLDDLELSLRTLEAFVATQRSSLQEREKLLTDLQSEREILESIVQADRATVDNLLQFYMEAQARENQQALVKERWIGFGIGVFSSLIASFLWLIGVRVYKHRNATGNLPQQQ